MKKQKFTIVRHIHSEIYHLEEVEGKPVKIDSCRQHDFFIHKEGRFWKVSEVKSGKHVGNGKTQKEAIETTNKRLSVIRKEKIAEAIEIGVADRRKALLGDLA
jgi:hypothetical protein